MRFERQFWRTLTPSAPLFERKEGDGSVVESYVTGGTRTQFSSTGDASEIMHIGSAERQLGSQVTALKSIRYQTQGDDDLRWDIEAQAGVLYEMTNELALQDGVTVYEPMCMISEAVPVGENCVLVPPFT